MHRHIRLDHRATSITGGNGHFVAFSLGQVFAFLELGQDLFPGLVAVHAGERTGIFVERAIGIEDIYPLQVMTVTDFEIVEIVSRCNLHHAGAELHIHVFIGDNRHFAVEYRQYDCLADIFFIPLVVGIDGNCGVAKHRLRPGRRHCQTLIRSLDLIANIPEVRIDLLTLEFVIGERGQASGTPIDNAVAAIYQTLLVKSDKDLSDRLCQPLVHGEPGAVPVATASDTLQLGYDRAEFLLLPGPDPLQELLPSDLLARDSLLGQRLLDHHLGGDTSMIDTRHPLGFSSLRPFPADQDILEGIVEGMPEMQNIRYIGRRNDYRIRLLIRIGPPVEHPGGQPSRIPFFLGLMRLVCFR